MTPVLQTPVGDVFDVDNTRFRIDFFHQSNAKQMIIRKPADLVDLYPGLIQRFKPRTMIELGICSGGGTALLALLTDPQRFVALELDPSPVVALDEFIRDRGLGDRVHPYYGVDQGDRERLTKIIDAEFGDDPIDLVIDDASHMLAETRASFEVLFPRLREGGAYVIEDWGAHHLYAGMAERRAEAVANGAPLDRPNRLLENLGRVLQIDEPGRDVPLTRLVIELLLARASSGEAVAEIDIMRNWIIVQRGAAELDARTFQVGDLYTDHFGQLA